jgi:hypothetical protein
MIQLLHDADFILENVALLWQREHGLLDNLACILSARFAVKNKFHFGKAA